MLRRLETRYTAGVAGTVTKQVFVNDGMQTVLQFQKVGTAAFTLTNRYLWGARGRSVAGR